ncbi:hypothetical protein CTI12_AA150420 [Artemisia annua]|uniref:Uncharacterized protein n=1 Tax=Artemisia annua TaxID=35608 RepID=A0A2U1ND44_ARTAN|nr:hypothetical protein CTI12_AA150420 [Artemisia annua]
MMNFVRKLFSTLVGGEDDNSGDSTSGYNGVIVVSTDGGDDVGNDIGIVGDEKDNGDREFGFIVDDQETSSASANIDNQESEHIFSGDVVQDWLDGGLDTEHKVVENRVDEHLRIDDPLELETDYDEDNSDNNEDNELDQNIMVGVENEMDEPDVKVHLFGLKHNNQEFTNTGVTIMVPEHIVRV